MSSCGSSNCSCGSSCKCGSGCGCSMYPDVEKNANQVTIIEGLAPSKMFSEGVEESFSAEGGQGCKCGAGCKCDPCTC
uniref:Metallothionein-like protein n=1 Tax=Plantago major TaxID=29818 RepID=Q5ZF73_PLAMJ|nr:metallothionein 1 [Plantago major]CAH59439.1 metallothionein 4 [Plantago major]